MKLLTTAIELEQEFRRLIKQYDNYYWATAWASTGSSLFKDLVKNKDKIRKIVVGIHFYQTHPDFIEEFLNNKDVHFIQQPAGTFHPKLYLFSNDNNPKWELIIGSANFTKEAFSRNTEACVLISNSDKDSDETFQQSLKMVEQTFASGKTLNKEDLNNYRIAWSTHKQKINSLSGLYGNTKSTSKPIHEVPMMNRSWKEFVKEVKREKIHELDRRIGVIDLAKALFSKVEHFNELNEDERKFIAGIRSNLQKNGAEDWAYFGSMEGAGIFKSKIKNNDSNVSKALDQIPLFGQITKSHYDNFLKYFRKAFTGNYIATATRLLSMKRPDTFICFDSKNRSALCHDFGIIQSNMDYSRYWDEIIVRIFDSNWWLNPLPKNEKEQKISEARAAFLDSLYYVE